MVISSCVSGGRSPRAISPERALAHPPRYKSACESCHSSKVRCTGKQPCQRCASNGWNCEYKFASRIGKPKGSRNKSTLRRLQMEAEQAERESARTSVSTTSSGSSPLPATPVIATTMQAPLHLAGIERTVPRSLMSTGLTEWSWPFSSESWTLGFGSDASLGSAIETTGPVEWEPPGNTVMTVDDPVSHNEGQPSNFEAIQPLVTPQPSLVLFDQNGIKDSTTITPRAASSRWSDRGTEDSAWSPTQSMETYHGGIIQSNYSWPNADAVGTTSYHDSDWTMCSCPCERFLTSQIHRLDLLREALTSNTTLRASLYETDESIPHIETFFECQVCEKNSNGLSLVVTIFTKVNELLMRPLHEKMDVMGLPFESGSRSGSALANTSGRLLEDMPAMMLLRRWLRLCEYALHLVETLQQQALLSLEPDLGQPTTQHPDSAIDHRVGLWSSSDLTSFGEMLWRFKRHLSECM